MHNYLNQAPLRDLRDPATPEPVATDAQGRSDQTFFIEATVRNGRQERRASLHGRDIYAITAPIVVEAAERVCQEAHEGGALPSVNWSTHRTFSNRLRAPGCIRLERDMVQLWHDGEKSRTIAGERPATSLTVNGKLCGRSRLPHVAARLPARNPWTDRDQERLRSRPMRRMHDSRQR